MALEAPFYIDTGYSLYLLQHALFMSQAYFMLKELEFNYI